MFFAENLINTRIIGKNAIWNLLFGRMFHFNDTEFCFDEMSLEYFDMEILIWHPNDKIMSKIISAKCVFVFYFLSKNFFC